MYPQNPMYRSTDSPCHGLFGGCSGAHYVEGLLDSTELDLDLELRISEQATRIARRLIGLRINCVA